MHLKIECFIIYCEYQIHKKLKKKMIFNFSYNEIIE